MGMTGAWSDTAARGLRSAHDGAYPEACLTLAEAVDQATDPVRKVLLKNSLALVYYQMGDYQTAQEQHDQSVAEWRALTGSASAAAIDEFAELLRTNGFADEARVVRERAQLGREPLLNPWHDLAVPALGGTLVEQPAAVEEGWDVKVNHGLHLLRHRCYEDSARRFSGALNSPGLQGCLATSCLSMAKFAMGDYTNARELHEDARRMWDDGGFTSDEACVGQLLAMFDQFEMTREAARLRELIAAGQAPILDPFEDMEQPESLVHDGTVGGVELGAGRSWSELVAEGTRLITSRHYDAALRQFAHSLRQAESPSEKSHSHGLMAVASFYQGDYQQAEESYRAAGKPTEPAALRTVVEALRAAGLEGPAAAAEKGGLINPFTDLQDTEGPSAGPVETGPTEREDGASGKPWWRFW